MFNPHIHQQQQQQQQQQFQQHLRQLQQLFQQQPPPPPPPPQAPPGRHVAHRHHQTPRAMPVPPQSAPPPRMVNLCQATQTTIIGPNPMLQGALLMQQMQGNMRSFGMGGQQQFRQFFAASARSSLLGPVPMGMAIKPPIMGFPAARPFHPHARYYNNTPAATTASSSSSSFPSITSTEATSCQSERKRDSEQMATAATDDQRAAGSTNETTEFIEKEKPGGVGESLQPTDDRLEEPAIKKQRTEGSEEVKEHGVVEAIAVTVEDVLSSGCTIDADNSQSADCILLEDGGFTEGSDVFGALKEDGAAKVHECLSAPSPGGAFSEDEQQVNLPLEEGPEGKESPVASPENQEEGEEGGADTVNKFYCYLCSITCHNQQNFRSHMNSVSHQQRMMEIQHMSNACLVTLLPRVQESLMGASKDGEKKYDSKHWCATCHTHFTSSITDHRRTEEHKLASRKAISSCTVCKKHFRTSQIFVEHLQSPEHRQKVEKLQEREDCEVLGNLASMDVHGFSLEEAEEGEEAQLGDGDQVFSEKQDGWASFKEVTLKDMTCDEHYDPDTVYGSSFFVPVAGFICRLCHKFYHFESSALHAHCKSLKHFEKLKNYREVLSQKDEAVASSGESLGTDTATDHLDESPRCDDAGFTADVNAMAQTQRQEERAEPERTSQDLSASHSMEEAASQSAAGQASPAEPPAAGQASPAEPPAAGQASPAEPPAAGQASPAEPPAAGQASPAEPPAAGQASPAEPPAGSGEEPEPGAAAVDADEGGAGEEDAVQGKKSDSGKAKATAKRRSGRAANRR